MVFIRYKYEGCPLFNFDLRLLSCCLIAYAEAAERLKRVILQRISKAAQRHSTRAADGLNRNVFSAIAVYNTNLVLQSEDLVMIVHDH